MEKFNIQSCSHDKTIWHLIYLFAFTHHTVLKSKFSESPRCGLQEKVTCNESAKEKLTLLMGIQSETQQRLHKDIIQCTNMLLRPALISINLPNLWPVHACSFVSINHLSLAFRPFIIILWFRSRYVGDVIPNSPFKALHLSKTLSVKNEQLLIRWIKVCFCWLQHFPPFSAVYSK